MDLSELIKRIRKSQNISQKDFAKKLGITPVHYCSIENKRKNGQFLAVDTAVVYNKSPQNLKEHLKQSKKFQYSQEELSKLLLFLKKLEMAGLEPREVLLKEQDELEVVLSFGTRLLLRSGNYDTALINLETLMEQDNLLSRNKGELSVSYIDLRYGNKIYFKPR